MQGGCTGRPARKWLAPFSNKEAMVRWRSSSCGFSQRRRPRPICGRTSLNEVVTSPGCILAQELLFPIVDLRW